MDMDLDMAERDARERSSNAFVFYSYSVAAPDMCFLLPSLSHSIRAENVLGVPICNALPPFLIPLTVKSNVCAPS